MTELVSMVKLTLLSSIVSFFLLFACGKTKRSLEWEGNIINNNTSKKRAKDFLQKRARLGNLGSWDWGYSPRMMDRFFLLFNQPQVNIILEWRKFIIKKINFLVLTVFCEATQPPALWMYHLDVSDQSCMQDRLRTYSRNWGPPICKTEFNRQRKSTNPTVYSLRWLPDGLLEVEPVPGKKQIFGRDLTQPYLILTAWNGKKNGWALNMLPLINVDCRL